MTKCGSCGRALGGPYCRTCYASEGFPNWEPNYYPDPPEPEPEPVGHWRKANDRPRSWVYICSECGLPAYFPNPKHFHSCGYKYCPNCGVKMIQEPK